MLTNEQIIIGHDTEIHTYLKLIYLSLTIWSRSRRGSWTLRELMYGKWVLECSRNGQTIAKGSKYK